MYPMARVDTNPYSYGSRPMRTDMSRRLAAGNPDVFAQLYIHIMLGRMGEPFCAGQSILIDSWERIPAAAFSSRRTNEANDA